MKKIKVMVLGASGMLGSMVTDVLSRDKDIDVVATVRTIHLAEPAKMRVPQARWYLFEITDESQTIRQLGELPRADWYVNAIGLTKPYTHDDNPVEIQRALRGNALFPHLLAQTAARYGGRVLQIATDCVYCGSKGGYVESDKHDALDVYGKTKSLGEALLPNVHHLRCSIVGPEAKSRLFLLEWFRKQPMNAKLNGFSNHRWNGLTTLHFARICHAIIKEGIILPQKQHIIPTGEVSKFELLQCFARSFSRGDICIRSVEAASVIDRTLQTENERLNQEIWKAAGYGERPPTIPEMIEELAAFNYRFEDLDNESIDGFGHEAGDYKAELHHSKA